MAATRSLILRASAALLLGAALLAGPAAKAAETVNV